MKRKQKKKKRYLWKLIIIILILILGYKYLIDIINIKKIFDLTENKEGNITKYTIYGTHLNIEGNININVNKNIYLVLIDNNRKEIKYQVDYKKNNKTTFKLSKYINRGINLEKLKNRKYFILLKIDNKYYRLNNKSNYNNTKYYSLNNRKLNINFKNYFKKNLMIIDNDKTFDNNYYDIVIDPGHGGIDTGASYKEYNESDFTLKYGLNLKKELEKSGFKTKLTRNKDIYLNPYGKKGRAVIPNKYKAKYLISLHLNSNDYNFSNGVEIYAPNDCELSLATSLAQNIQHFTGTNYSKNNDGKVSNGVYVKNYSYNDIIESKNNSYKPYNITTSTPYLYMIRETGGIMTHAYIDGRNKKEKKNYYYNSNIGVESYLIELGYMNNKKDLDNLINNQKQYIKAIAQSLKKELNK